MQTIFMVNMARGVDRGCVRPTTTKTTLRNIAAMLQLIPSHAALVYSAHLGHPYYG